MKKPTSVTEYCTWLSEVYEIECDSRLRLYYDTVTKTLRDEFHKSSFWQNLKASEIRIEQEYLVETGYPLYGAANTPSEMLIKPFSSFLEKTFRQNVLKNPDWPSPPPDGWYFPTNCFARINDLLRTTYVVKYLDGVDFLFEQFSRIAQDLGLTVRTDYEARDEGYYAGHFNVEMSFSIPEQTWDTRSIRMRVEIQITTQLQEVIRKLLHQHYENRRIDINPITKKWQWDYRKDTFSANYLGHILHYIEGTILEVRDKERKH